MRRVLQAGGEVVSGDVAIGSHKAGSEEHENALSTLDRTSSDCASLHSALHGLSPQHSND